MSKKKRSLSPRSLISSPVSAPRTAPATVQFSMSSKKLSAKQKQLNALKAESERNLIDQIRRNLARPVGERTNFLRKRINLRGSAL